ncbi:MAG: ATP-dependent Clp protease ATP-binding subunit ClpX, partial [Opitutales bacterium]
VDLDKIICDRIGTKVLGFDVDPSKKTKLSGPKILSKVHPEDLVQYGLIPEFVGRLPVMSALDELKQQELQRILVETKNSLTKQYRKLFALEGVELRFTKDAIAAIATKAVALKTGARALRSIMEQILLDLMYELPDIVNIASISINGKVVRGRARPRVTRTPAKKKSAA